MKRGPGRPPIPEAKDIHVRVGPSHRRELGWLITEGKADTLVGAMRYLIEESAKERSRKP